MTIVTVQNYLRKLRSKTRKIVLEKYIDVKAQVSIHTQIHTK